MRYAGNRKRHDVVVIIGVGTVLLHSFDNKMRYSFLLLPLLLGQVVESINYSPLACNNGVAEVTAPIDSCTPFSKLVNETLSADQSGRIVVPCGTCSIIDYTDGETVTLPNGLNVVGRLHFPSTSNVKISTTMVYVQGLLDLPTPLESGNEVTINLYGSDEYWFAPYDGSTDAQAVGKKPFVVAGGKIHIQAVPNECEAWSHLVEKVTDYKLKVSNDFAGCLKWNDELLVTSSTKEWNAESIRRITAINPSEDSTDTSIITIDNAITRSLPGLLSPEPEFAVEVASLSRNVHFTAETDDPEGDHIGGHFMVGWTSSVEQVITGVKISNFGQGGNLGRYPMHFHFSGTSPSTISKNVILNSNQRCILIHVTDGVTVDNNVCYNHAGHGIATETGNEENNIFRYNLVARTKLLPSSQDNGQSDTAGVHNKHQAASYWIRSFKNEFIGNVAAGSVSQCWWTEMTKTGNREMSTFYGKQLYTSPVSSFRDNVAHSCKGAGMVTYFRGWKPEGTHDDPGGVWENFKVYKNPDNGFKFHQTGPIKILNSIIADNNVGIMYGKGVEEVHLENTIVDGASRDWRERLGKGCSNHIGIKHSSNRWAETPERSMAFTNVTFQNFCGNGKTFQFYYDSRSSKRGMGDAIEMRGTKLLNVSEKNKPSFKCQYELRNNFLEDIDGVLGPSDKGPGFIVRDRSDHKAFLPPNSCTPLWYSGSNEWGQCSAFCEGVCLRFMRIVPHFGEWTSHTNMKLLLSNGEIEHEFSSEEWKDFQLLLPSGKYHGRIFKEDGTELFATEMKVVAIGDKPLCEDYVEIGDFTFSSAPPTLFPSSMPSLTASPTHTPDPVVRIQSMVNKRFLWVAASGGFTASSDPNPWTNSRITLKKHECVKEFGFYHYDSGISSPCFLVVWENANGRRMFAQNGKEWKSGVGTTTGTIEKDQIWFLEKVPCSSDFEDGTCGLIRNAFNGRSMYDNSNLVLGASPAGEPEYVWTSPHYVWHFMDLVAGTGLNLTGLASEPMFTRSPVPAPITPSPSTSISATNSPEPDPAVRIQSANTGRYLWTRSDGGFKANPDELPLTNTVITLVRYACPQSAGSYHFDSGLTSPCYLLKFEEAGGRRMFAKTGQEWKNGIGTSGGQFFQNQVWFLQATVCIDGASGRCVLIRNAQNGRTMYDSDDLVLGASPGGTTDMTWPSQKWHLVDAQSGLVIDPIDLY